MYRIERTDGRVLIYDWSDKLIYSAPLSARVLYRNQVGVQSDEVGKLTDKQLLVALASAVKLDL